MNKEELLAAYAAGRRYFVGVNLSGADLRGANLCDSYFRRANLRGADLRGVILSRADLTGAKLSGADLYSANLRNTRMVHVDLRVAKVLCADFRGADLQGADLSDSDLSGTTLVNVNLTGAIGFRFPGAPDPLDLRQRVADQIREYPELHDQRVWGQRESCGTPCCVGGWACRLGGGDRGHIIPTAATLLLHCDGYRLPSFASDTPREAILRDLLVPIKEQK